VRGDVAGVPAVLFLWLGVICLVAFLLSATTFGRRVYAVGNNPEASYLAGINTRLVTVALFMLSGMFAAMGGIVLVAYSGNPTLGLGDPYLLQSVAAIVIGGVSILGRPGLFLGTVAGAITLVTLLTLLRALQMPEYSRGIVYGVVILVILFAYGREREPGERLLAGSRWRRSPPGRRGPRALSGCRSGGPCATATSTTTGSSSTARAPGSARSTRTPRSTPTAGRWTCRAPSCSARTGGARWSATTARRRPRSSTAGSAAV
jgi:hypothetical protein